MHLATSLAKFGRHDEAWLEFRKVLSQTPDDDSVRLALAATYLVQGKVSHADVLVELVTGRDNPTPKAFILLARVRLAERDLGACRE